MSRRPAQDNIQRVPPSAPLTPTERMIAELISLGHNYVAIGEYLGITKRTVKFYAQNAARKIPGDFPVQIKLAVWWRGAPLYVLTGKLDKTAEVVNA